MPSTHQSRSALAGFAVAGVAFSLGGIVQIAFGHPTGEDVEGVGGYGSLSFFVVSMLALAPALWALARSTERRAGRIGGTAAAIGTGVLGVVCITSLVNGHDLSVFLVLAPITNAAWFFGTIAVAVALRRDGRIPLWMAIGLPVAQIFALPLSAVGGGIVAGAFYVAASRELMASRQARPRILAATA